MDFMHAALLAAKRSPDTSTQNGVLIASDAGRVFGINEFPRLVAYSDERLQRPLKYSYTEHAERNACYKAASWGVKCNGATMVALWAACADCARAIIQSGINTLVRYDHPTNHVDHWVDSIRLGDEMMREAGVEIVDFKPRQPYGVELLRDGKLVMF